MIISPSRSSVGYNARYMPPHKMSDFALGHADHDGEQKQGEKKEYIRAEASKSDDF